MERHLERYFGLLLLHSADPGLVPGSVWPLLAPTVQLGRDALGPPHLQFAEGRTSRVHATLHATGAGLPHLLLDEQSTNGSWVNGVRVKRVQLQPGDLLRIGDSFLLYRPLNELPDPSRPRPDSPLVYASAALEAVVGRIERLAPSNLTVLVLGETGTGKELVAQQVHARSGRSGPFIPVNCGALSPGLIESELFGHVRGAFTGALGAAPGLFRAADHGTLFLDEIGELPLALQTRLLRVLECGEIRPVGASASLIVDTRVVAATNANLAVASAAGTFRADLYARLDEVRIDLSPLRQRIEDILPLVRHFASSHGARKLALEPAAVEALLSYAWPYNVRELEKIVRLVLLEHPQTDRLTLDLLPSYCRGVPRLAAEPERDREIVQDPEAFRSRLLEAPGPQPADLQELMRHFAGNVQLAAGFVGKDRRQVYRWLERHGIDPDSFRRN